jgi:hypothetical protein
MKKQKLTPEERIQFRKETNRIWLVIFTLAGLIYLTVKTSGIYKQFL